MSNNKDNPFDTGFGSGMSGGVSYEAPSVDSSADQMKDQAPAPSGETTTPLIGLSSSDDKQAEPVLDITTAQFMSEVVEYSRGKPVLIDFWAPWCGPCKQLTPVLEAAAARAGGKIRLVKMNIDDHPEVAGQMGIQSIPAVVAFVDGQPKDAFMGAKSEREIDQFIEKLVGPSGPSPLETALEEAAGMMGDGKWGEAGRIFSEIIKQIPDNRDALAGYGLCALNTGNFEQARQALANAGPVDGHQGLETLRAAIDLAEQAEQVGDFGELEEAVKKDPKNFQARYDLALALNGVGRREEAADQLFEIMMKDRNWNEEAAKKQLLQFFEAWGQTDPDTLAARRRLSSLLFS